MLANNPLGVKPLGTNSTPTFNIGLSGQLINTYFGSEIPSESINVTLSSPQVNSNIGSIFSQLEKTLDIVSPIIVSTGILIPIKFGNLCKVRFDEDQTHTIKFEQDSTPAIKFDDAYKYSIKFDLAA
ncbi:hypothetical protein UFOVP84_37 [uncultured Caudovirales phage]|uniref:Uncharacterized protein n=1 Tax=uncultured Caudovirales phage TaxID=2100421 RepID=A0A6J5L015_9CAUD|nr:hypothetical protein UFOVP84_37 [uncultured Caudovirales phage]